MNKTYFESLQESRQAMNKFTTSISDAVNQFMGNHFTINQQILIWQCGLVFISILLCVEAMR